MLGREALAITALTNLDLGVFVCIMPGADVVFATQAAENALRALGATDPDVPDPVHDLLRGAKDHFGDARFVAARDGRQFAVRCRRLDEPRGCVLATISPKRSRAADRTDFLRKAYGLKPRECVLVNLVCEGLRNDEIAERMRLTPGTVKQYLHAVFTALDVRSRAQLVATLERSMGARSGGET